jgi:GYF domain 2
VADEWYYADNAQQKGPVPVTVLREMAANGILKPTDLVWTEGMSQWAPASATRGIFRPPPQTPVRAPSRPALLPEPYADGEDDSFAPNNEPAATLNRGPGGVSTAKLAFIGVFVFVVALAVIVGIVTTVIVANPQTGRSYAVSLNFEGQEDVRALQFRQNERVRITVTANEWGGVFEPDVDLFVVDPQGNLVAEDTRPDKDCELTFIAAQTGQYRVVVVLDTGQWVRCTVRY